MCMSAPRLRRNQKTCYALALAAGAGVVVMTPPGLPIFAAAVTAIASMVAYGVYDVALGSRILGGGALRGGIRDTSMLRIAR